MVFLIFLISLIILIFLILLLFVIFLIVLIFLIIFDIFDIFMQISQEIFHSLSTRTLSLENNKIPEAQKFENLTMQTRVLGLYLEMKFCKSCSLSILFIRGSRVTKTPLQNSGGVTQYWNYISNGWDVTNQFSKIFSYMYQNMCQCL